MGYRLLANIVALFHGFVIVPLLLGGSVAMYFWAQPPMWLASSFAVAAFLALASYLIWHVCFLTDWEQALRARAGMLTYKGGFIRHYLAKAGVRATDREILIMSLTALILGSVRIILLWYRI